MNFRLLYLIAITGWALLFVNACKDEADFAGQTAKKSAQSEDAEPEGTDGDGDGDNPGGDDTDGNGTDGNDDKDDLDEGGGNGDGVPSNTEECLTFKADQYNIALVFDNSGSQTETDPQAIRRTAAINFVDTFEQFKQDHSDTAVNMSVISFSGIATKGNWHSLGQGTQGIAQDITVATTNPEGATNYSNPLNAANELLTSMTQTPRAKNYVIFLTDGEPNALSNPGFPGVTETLQDIEAARNSLITTHNASIIAIAAGNGIQAEGVQAVEKLADLPSQGGGQFDSNKYEGQFFRATNGDELNQVWDNLFKKIGDCDNSN